MSHPETAAPKLAPAASLPAPLLNAIGGLLLLAFAIWLWFGAAAIDGAGQGLVGPDGFPRIVAVLLAVSSVLLVLQSARVAKGRVAAIRVQRPAAVAGAIVLVVIYPVLIAYLGYYAATAIWMLPFLFLAGMRNPVRIVAGTAGFLLFTKVLFQMVLGTPLP